MATKKLKTRIINSMDTVKTQTKNLHDSALNATDTIVDNGLQIGKQWQKVFAKAMEGSTVLMGKQQDLVFDTLETVREQVIYGGKRVSKLLQVDDMEIRPLETPLIQKIESQRKAAVKKVKSTLKNAPKTAKAVGKKTRKAVKKATPKTDDVKNDLKIIEGIGPKIESVFNKAGIKSYTDMANADLKTLQGILELAGPRYNMHDPATWKKQAKLAAAGKMDALKKLQDELKGGKKVK